MDSVDQDEPTQVLDNVDLDLLAKVLTQTVFSEFAILRNDEERITENTKQVLSSYSSSPFYINFKGLIWTHPSLFTLLYTFV